VNGEQGSSAMAAGRLDKEKARRAARHPARPGQNCSAAPGESRPVVDHGACEGKRDCVEVCPYDVFEVRQIDDSDFAKLSHVRDSFEVAARLDAGAENREHGGIFARQFVYGHRGDGCCARFGDVSPIDDGFECAGLGIEHDDGGEVRRQTSGGVRFVERHQFRA